MLPVSQWPNIFASGYKNFHSLKTFSKKIGFEDHAYKHTPKLISFLLLRERQPNILACHFEFFLIYKLLYGNLYHPNQTQGAFDEYLKRLNLSIICIRAVND